jgi:hypothetical protein
VLDRKIAALAPRSGRPFCVDELQRGRFPSAAGAIRVLRAESKAAKNKEMK